MQTQYAKESVATTRTPDLRQADDVLQEQNSRYANIVDRVIRLGHRLRDTNVPEAKSAEQMISGEGLLPDFARHLEYYKIHNNKMEEVLNKLEEII